MGGQVSNAVGHEGPRKHIISQDLGLSRFGPDHQLGQQRRKKDHVPLLEIQEFDLLSGLDGQGAENQVPSRQFRVAAAQLSKRADDER